MLHIMVLLTNDITHSLKKCILCIVCKWKILYAECLIETTRIFQRSFVVDANIPLLFQTLIQDKHVFNRKFSFTRNFKMKFNKYFIENEHISLDTFSGFKYGCFGSNSIINKRCWHLRFYRRIATTTPLPVCTFQKNINYATGKQC